MFIHVSYYAGLLHMLGFLLSPKSYANFCYKLSGQFFLFYFIFIFTIYTYKLLKAFCPKASVKNSSG